MSSTEAPVLTDHPRRRASDNLRWLAVSSALKGHGLQAHLQPIVDLRDASIVAHESLIRSTSGNLLSTPDELFAAARDERCLPDMEQRCLQIGIATWAGQRSAGRLFLNLSAEALDLMLQRQSIERHVEALTAIGAMPSSLVIELTEHERVADVSRLCRQADDLRRLGVRFALDDFGDGRSSLRLWSELRPEFVKIDRYFIHNVHSEAVKVQTLRGLIRFAELFGTELVAEGIETEAELRVVRDLDLRYGQGYLLGRPQATIRTSLDDEVAEIITSRQIAVLPETSRATDRHFVVGKIVEPTPPCAPEESVNGIAKRFTDDDTLRAVALVVDGRAVGLIDRRTFIDRYAKPYFKELYGRKPCALFANPSPLRSQRTLLTRRHEGAAVTTIRCLALLLLLALPWAAPAQEQRASREREALRRAQAALQQAQQQAQQREAELQAGQAKLQGEKDAAAAQAQQAAAQSRSLQGRLAQAQRESARLTQERDQARRDTADALQRIAALEAALQQQQAMAARDVTERTQANAAMSALLAQTTQRLADARERNDRLHAIGLEAIDRYRNKTATETALQNDPVIGVTAVRIDNVAEALRTQLDKEWLTR